MIFTYDDYSKLTGDQLPWQDITNGQNSLGDVMRSKFRQLLQVQQLPTRELYHKFKILYNEQCIWLKESGMLGPKDNGV